MERKKIPNTYILINNNSTNTGRIVELAPRNQIVDMQNRDYKYTYIM